MVPAAGLKIELRLNVYICRSIIFPLLGRALSEPLRFLDSFYVHKFVFFSFFSHCQPNPERMENYRLGIGKEKLCKVSENEGLKDRAADRL